MQFKAIGVPLFTKDDGGIDFKAAAKGAIIASLPDSNPQVELVDTGHAEIDFHVDATNAAECEVIARRELVGLLREPYVMTRAPSSNSPKTREVGSGDDLGP